MNGQIARPLAALTLAAGFSLILTGCGSDYASVEGTITLDGSPLSNVSVVFEPRGTEGTSAFGSTDSNGYYELLTTEEQSGAMPGEYVVRVRSPEPAFFGIENEPESPTAEAPEAEFNEKYVNAVPEKYSAGSELTATVEPGSNTIDFDLTGD